MERQLSQKSFRSNLFILCLTRVLYTLGFSVMFVSLALYFNSHKNFSHQQGADITSVFLALNFGLPLLGGILGNKHINFKKLFQLGLLFQSIGYLLLSSSNTSLTTYLSLALILMGGMVFSTSMVEFIASISKKQTEQHRVAMLLNYASMNVGFIAGSILAGWFSLKNDYHSLFIILSIFPLACIWLVSKNIIYKSKRPETFAHPNTSCFIIFLFIVIAITALLYTNAYAHNTLIICSCFTIGISLIYCTAKSGLTHFQKNAIFIFYLILNIIFWSVFMLTPISLMYFIKDAVNLTWHHLHLQPQWLDIDPYVLIVGAPLLAKVTMLVKKQFNKSIPTHLLFAAGLIAVCSAALVMFTFISQTPVNSKLPIFCILAYLALLAIGELFIAPEGYTLPSRLAPSQLRGLYTGIWVSSISLGSLAASHIAQSALKVHTCNLTSAYSHLFHNITIFTAVAVITVLAIGHKTKHVL